MHTWQALPGETRVLKGPASPISLNEKLSPPVSGALGVIGISGRVCYEETNQALPLKNIKYDNPLMSKIQSERRRCL